MAELILGSLGLRGHLSPAGKRQGGILSQPPHGAVEGGLPLKKGLLSYSASRVPEL